MASYKQLRYGDSNEEVRTLQQKLNEAGASLETDGIFGNKTLAAVREYQRKNGLAVDGIAGAQTLGHLYRSSADQVTDSGTQSETEQGSAQLPQSGFAWEGQEELNNRWQKYLAREAFSYDMESDPLYQQYRQIYQDTGRLAMDDTIGMASALTGGYGNSYAQTAGRQAYESYLKKLNNVMPDLYNAAYDRYQAEGQALYNEILLREQRRQQAYQEQQDNFSRITGLMAMGYAPTDAELSSAGLTRDQASAIGSYYGYKTNQEEKETGSTNYNNGKYGTNVVKLVQQYYGVTPDGMWGSESKKVGGTIDEAVNTILKKGETERAKAYFKKKGSFETWSGRGVGYSNYLKMAEDWLDGERFTAEEFFWLETKFGLIEL